MLHIVYIDISAKVEQWPRASAVAMSNGDAAVWLVSGEVKQRARALLIAQHGSKNVHYRLLAALVYLVVRDVLHFIRQIVIDRDYTGALAEATIRNLLLHLLRKDQPRMTAGFVQFANVKGSRADELARQVYRDKVSPTRVIGWDELEDLLKK